MMSAGELSAAGCPVRNAVFIAAGFILRRCACPKSEIGFLIQVDVATLHIVHMDRQANSCSAFDAGLMVRVPEQVSNLEKRSEKY